MIRKNPIDRLAGLWACYLDVVALVLATGGTFATGGAGRIYASTTNAHINTGGFQTVDEGHPAGPENIPHLSVAIRRPAKLYGHFLVGELVKEAPNQNSKTHAVFRGKNDIPDPVYILLVK